MDMDLDKYEKQYFHIPREEMEKLRRDYYTDAFFESLLESIHIERDNEKQHGTAALQPQPLAHFISLTVQPNQDKQFALYGTIVAHFFDAYKRPGAHQIYSRASDVPEIIGTEGTLTLNGPDYSAWPDHACLPLVGSVVAVNLFDQTNNIFANTSFSLDDIDDNYDQLKSIVVPCQQGSLTLHYIALPLGLHCRLEARLRNTKALEKHDIVNVTGKIVARYDDTYENCSSEECVLFNKKDTEFERVEIGSRKLFPLSRTWVSLPAYSSLIIQVDLSEFGSGRKIANGTIELVPQNQWMTGGTVSLDNMFIKVIVAWFSPEPYGRNDYKCSTSLPQIPTKMVMETNQGFPTKEVEVKNIEGGILAQENEEMDTDGEGESSEDDDDDGESSDDDDGESSGDDVDDDGESSDDDDGESSDDDDEGGILAQENIEGGILAQENEEMDTGEDEVNEEMDTDGEGESSDDDDDDGESSDDDDGESSGDDVDDDGESSDDDDDGESPCDESGDVLSSSLNHSSWSLRAHTNKPWSSDAVEIFSVFIGQEKSKAVQIYGSIEVLRDNDELCYIFKRDEKDALGLSENLKSIPIPDGSRVFDDCSSLQIKFDIKDVEGCLAIKGYEDWPAMVIDSSHLYEKQLCSLIRGQHGGFATIHYSLFSEAVGVNIKVLLNIKTKSSDVNPKVWGSLVTQYSRYDYSSHYNKDCYRCVLFKGTRDDLIQISNDSTIPLSRSTIVVPTYSSLIVNVDLSFSVSDQKLSCAKMIDIGEGFKTVETNDYLLHIELDWCEIK